MSKLYFLKSDICNSATDVEIGEEYLFIADNIEQAYDHFFRIYNYLILDDDEEREDGDKFADLTNERRYERMREILDGSMEIHEMNMDRIPRAE